VATMTRQTQLPSSDAVDMGDEAQFRQLFSDSYTPLLAYARRRVAASSEADDVVSEVFATAWRRRDELDPTQPALPWLYGIAGNVVRNQWRSTSRRLRLVDKLEAQPEPSSARTDSAHELRSALEQLSFDDQELLRLVAWEGLSHAEVGSIFDCSANAVGIRMYRARQHLADILDPAPNPTAPTAPSPTAPLEGTEGTSR
jgi:RNA polymerase sigma-70 factor (ECF subfamily)